jgi:tetratricopeptide (TPR) repeat protein
MDRDLELALWSLQERVVNAIDSTSGVGREMWATVDRASSVDLLLPLIENVGSLMQEAVSLLAQQTAQLKSLQELLANPEETKAAEFYRRGEQAFNNNWLDEGLVELNRAIEASPFHYPSHLMLGRLHLAQGNVSDAAAAFTKALRYAASKDALAAAVAGVSAVGLFEQLGEQAGLTRVADETKLAFREAMGDSPSGQKVPVPSELFLRLSVALNEPTFGAKAIASNPGLLPVASLSMGPQLSAQVLSKATPVLASRVHRIIDATEEVARHLDGNTDPNYYGDKCTLCDCPIVIRDWRGARPWPACQGGIAPETQIIDRNYGFDRLSRARHYQKQAGSQQDAFESFAMAEYLAFQAAAVLTYGSRILEYRHKVRYTGAAPWLAAPPFVIIIGRDGITRAHQSAIYKRLT